MAANVVFRRRLLTVLLVIMICFCMDTAYTIFNLHLGDLSSNRLVNVSADLVGSMVCVALYVTIFLDKRKTDETFHFLLMIFFELLLLNADASNWIVDGSPGKESILLTSNLALFIFIILMTWELWQVVKNDLDIPEKELGLFNRIILIIGIIGLVNILLTPITGWVFYIENSTYYRGYHNFLSNCPVNLMAILIMIAVLKYGKSTKRKIALIAYTVIPMVAMLLQIYFYGISVFYIAMIITLILIYGNYYVSRGTYIQEIDNELMEQRFAAMYSQIQPHFLYNALTSIMAIKGNPPETLDAISDFGKYLRGNLDTLSVRNAVPLRKELSHVENYTNLEKLRFKERLNVVFDIQDHDGFIPALTIQLLVENAIRHGITMKEEGGTVTVRTFADDKAHYILVIDDGVGFDTGLIDTGEEKLGIKNLRARLDSMVGGKLDVESTIGVGTTVTVTIPRH